MVVFATLGGLRSKTAGVSSYCEMWINWIDAQPEVQIPNAWLLDFHKHTITVWLYKCLDSGIRNYQVIPLVAWDSNSIQMRPIFSRPVNGHPPSYPSRSEADLCPHHFTFMTRIFKCRNKRYYSVRLQNITGFLKHYAALLCILQKSLHKLSVPAYGCGCIRLYY